MICSTVFKINPKQYNLLIGVLLLLFAGCEDINDRDKFQPPEWLEGKLYTAITSQDYLSLFSECIRTVGFDTILDVSGSWTVFAPTNGAVERYLADHQYSTVGDIPRSDLNSLVRMHIVQNPWTLEQLKTNGIDGWRDEGDPDWHAYAFKFQTILKRPDQEYWIRSTGGRERIVSDSVIAERYKIVHTESRKYAPLFYDEYMGINGVTPEDYRYYFDRAYEPGYAYYAGGKILKSDLFAENGFIHVIDRVISPMLNAEEILRTEAPGESYKSFLKLIYWYYPEFKMNDDATFSQASVRYRGITDTIWNLSFTGLRNTNEDDLLFDIQDERTWIAPGNVTDEVTRLRHSGLVAPTDEPFNAFMDEILTAASGYPHWTDYTTLPRDIVDIIVAQNFSNRAIYPSSDEYRRFFIDQGRFRQNEGDIIRQEFGSNCTFIGIDSYAPDRAFTSVTGPVFCRPKYSYFRLALQYSGLLDAIATYEGDLCFFPIPDDGLRSDSSLLLNWIDMSSNQYVFQEYNVFSHSIVYVSPGTLGNRLLNHIGTSLPDGSANKEFIRTLNGSYIVWNNSDNTVRGTRPSTVRYNGLIETINHPELMSFPVGNNVNYSVRYWFNSGNVSMQSILSGYPEFYSLLNRAGMLNSLLYGNDYLTVFVPTDEALNTYQADTLSNDQLRDFLGYHILEDVLIFTDNKYPSGNYQTIGGNSLAIQTDPDVIRILDDNGTPGCSIQENEQTTNRMATSGSRVIAVVHQIDTVLVR